jgi:dolichyl-phosphate beta-glucosyltransferase
LPPPTYSIVLPAYNESARIRTTLKKITAHAAERGWNAEVIVVNDGSNDDTAAVVQALTAQCAGVRVLENGGNRGKGYSVRNGMLHASGNILLFSDADLSSPIEEADKLFAALASGADVAIGSRWLDVKLQTKKQPFYRQIFGRTYNLALRLILGLGFKDTQCGFKAFNRTAAELLFPMQQIERWGFDPELLYLARRFHLRVDEVPVKWAHREGTRINPLRDGLHMLFEIFRVRWNAISGRYKKPESH